MDWVVLQSLTFTQKTVEPLFLNAWFSILFSDCFVPCNDDTPIALCYLQTLCCSSLRGTKQSGRINEKIFFSKKLARKIKNIYFCVMLLHNPPLLLLRKNSCNVFQLINRIVKLFKKLKKWTLKD
jgi:hypothetical protein